MSVHIKNIAIAYLIIFLDFNINLSSFTIYLLPNILGWYILLITIKKIKHKQLSLNLLNGPCNVLLIFSLFQLMPNLLNNFSNVRGILSLIEIMFLLYFHFQFLTDIGEIILSYGVDNKKVYFYRNILTITCTLTQLLRFLPNVVLFLPVLLIGIVAAILTSYQLMKAARKIENYKET